MRMVAIDVMGGVHRRMPTRLRPSRVAVVTAEADADADVDLDVDVSAEQDAAVKPPAISDVAADTAGISDERALVDAVRAGNGDAFDELAGRHMRRAFAVAYRILGQRQDAEDIVQDGLLAALMKIDTFDSDRPFGPWLLRIIANRAINARKARTLRRTEPLPEGAPSRGDSPFDATRRSEMRGELQRALAGLPEQQRWIVELFEIEGFSGPEIAAMLEIADGTVRWHLHQARQALRTTLEPFAVRTP
jgi:RNA polymerase sigma-70 factor (ECF subfamily)